jgi:hypothetical protein
MSGVFGGIVMRTWLFNVKEVRLEKTFWGLKTFLTHFDHSPIGEGIAFDEDGCFFGQFIV